MKCLKILNILFSIYIVKCYSMSKDELEDFSNFLKKTSSLDQTLKKAPGVGSFDEDEPISDVNAWEESGKFEGDLILNDRQRRLIVQNVAVGLSRNGLNDITKRWPENTVIFYIQREHFNGEQVRAILQGIEDLARSSCVKFRPYRKGDRDAVVVQGSRRGCFSQVGYQGGYQVLNLSGRHPVGRGCFRHGTVVHEFLHTLGFYHMQSSPDRDDYIDVRWENIIEPAKHNFRKYNSFSVSDFGVGYDYDSVLHYSKKAFSSNGQDTLVPKQSGADIGQRIGLSDKDTQKLNKMYCDANNNDDHDGPKNQQTNKKRKSKNQPFDGHGIGYHQGKTLVIKVPTTTTIQVSSMPVYRSFDYSSKLPTTPVVQRVGTGQEIEYWSYPYTLYTNRKTHAHTKHKTDPHPFSDGNKIIKLGLNNDPVQKNNTQEDALDKVSKRGPENLQLNKTDELTSAIKRLEEIVKTRLVPIQYDTDYSKYKIPDFKFEPDAEIQKVDELFNGSSSLHPIEKDNTYTTKLPDKEKTHVFIKSLSNSNDITLPKKGVEELHLISTKTDNNNFSEMDSSYRTAYPLRDLDYYKENHELAEYKYNPTNKLSNKYNYDELYNKDNDTRRGSAIKTHIKTFGDNANPVGDPKWYRNEELSNTPLRYDQYRYTYNKPKNEHDRFEKLQKHVDSSNETAEDTVGYSLFGKSVPTNDKWFKDHQVKETPQLYMPQNIKTHSKNSNEEDRSENKHTEENFDYEPYDKTNKSYISYPVLDKKITVASGENFFNKPTSFKPTLPYSSPENYTYNKEHDISKTPENYQSHESEENSDEITRYPDDTSYYDEPVEITDTKWFKDHTTYKPPDKNRIPYENYGGSNNREDSHDGSENSEQSTSTESDEESIKYNEPTKFDDYRNYYEPPFKKIHANIKRRKTGETSY